MRKILWASLIYTWIVIVWGAWVRISHSGDGCGNTWPLCHDVVIPVASAAGKTWVEYTHRLMSGLYGFLMLGLLIWLSRKPGVSKQSKFWIRLSFVFMITEALLGAKLVKAGLVATNDTPYRAFIMALHFLNSLLLSGSLALTALYAGASEWKRRDWSEITGASKIMLRRLPAFVIILFLLIGITGTVAALSNTLYPAGSVLQGLVADLNPTSHYLVRLRGLHPTLGFLIGASLTLFFYLLSDSIEDSRHFLKNRTFILSIGFGVTFLAGTTTLFLEAPVPLKLLHLLLAHGLWVLILAFWQSLRTEPANAPHRAVA